jgi:4-hydroxy-tetrahydrodipicolinate synthase
MTSEYRGVVVPMVTPFQENGDLDEQALRDLTHFLVDHGVDSLFPAGSTGEGWALSSAERRRVFEIVIEEAKGRVPVYGGTGAISTRIAIELTLMAEEVGCDAVVMITPFYIVPTQEELFEHYLAIARSVNIGVIPYNNPNRAVAALSPELISRLSDVPNLVGLKDSGGNLGLTLRFITETNPMFSVLQGRDDLFYPSLAIGVNGIVACVANIAPALTVELYRAFMVGEHERARTAQLQLAQLRYALSLGSFPSMIKAGMEMIGLKAGVPRAPVSGLSGQGREKLRVLLQDLGIL